MRRWGHYDEAEMNRLHDHIQAQIVEYGLALDAIYFCPRHPQVNVKYFAIECGCRKPAPVMLLQSARDFNFYLAAGVLIGDKLSDVQAGKRA